MPRASLLNPLLRQHASEFAEVLGPPWWAGGESVCWRQGRYVLKLTVLAGNPRKELARFRRLMRMQDAPIAPVLDVRVVGRIRKKTMIWDPELRRFVRPSRRHAWRSPGVLVILQTQAYVPDAATRRPRSARPTLPPHVWESGNARWAQKDATAKNARGGVWVDLGAVREQPQSLPPRPV